MKRRIAFLILSSALLGLTACKVDGGGFGSSSGGGIFGSSSEQASSTRGDRSSTGGQYSNSSKSHEGPWTLADSGDVYVWCTDMEKDYFMDMADRFKELHPEYKGIISRRSAVEDYDTYFQLRADPGAAADLFIMPDDNIRSAVKENLLTPFEDEDIAEIEGLYDEMAMDSGRINGKVYGLPYRNDNGYVLCYDKTIVSDEDAKTVEGIIAACKRAGATFNFNLTNGWYAFSPVYAAGGRTYFDENDNFRAEFATQEVADALYSLQAIVREAGDTWSIDEEDSPMAEHKIGAIVKWNNEAFERSVLGDNLGITVMPTFQGDGKTYQLKSFQCFKTLSIRNASNLDPATLVAAREFAKFLCSDYGAEQRLVNLGQGVPNKTLIAKPGLWSSEWALALTEQQLNGDTIAQSKATCGDFWDPATNLGTGIARNRYSTRDEILADLQQYERVMMQSNY